MDALVTHVAEHGNKGLQIHISLTDKSAFVALTGFKALDLPGFTQYPSTSLVTAEKIDVTADPNDQFIGYWTNGMIPVYVKPFARAGYIVCTSTQSDQKPLMYRIHPNANMSGLRLWAKTNDGSLFNDQYEWLGAFAPLNRSALAVLYTGAAVYASPFTAADLEK